jgi:predicted ABC-type sugar transport system permease subunit
MKFVANKQQSIFDAALQVYGDIEGVAFLLADNPDLLQPDGTLKAVNNEYIVRTIPINIAVATKLATIKPSNL